MARANSGRGFSLIELVIVVAIVAMLAAIATPRFASASAGYRLEAAARLVASQLSEARDAARASSAAVTVSVSSRVVRTHDANGVKIRETDFDTASAAAALSAWDLGGDRGVQFNGFGMPDAAGTLTVVVGDAQRVVSISAQGRVSVGPQTVRANVVPPDATGEIDDN